MQLFSHQQKCCMAHDFYASIMYHVFYVMSTRKNDFFKYFYIENII